MAKNIEELRAEYPGLVEQIEAQARAAAEASAGGGTGNGDPVAAERQRIRDIDALASLFDDETVNEAKYGEHSCTAQEMAYRAALNAAKQGRKYLNAMEDDTETSGAQDVNAAGNDGTGENQDDCQAAIAQAKADAAKYMKMKEGK